MDKHLRSCFQIGTRIGLLGLLAGFTAWIPTARSQVAFPEAAREEIETPRVLMLAPREYQQRLKQAERAIEQQQYGEAISHLGSLLHLQPQEAVTGPVAIDPVQEDYFLGRAGESLYQTSLRSQALRLLGSLPSAGRELYELQFGAEARRLLEQALENSDPEGLAELSRRYFHTDAGSKATFLLGRLYFDQGRPLAAALCLQRLADAQVFAPRFDPELSLLLAGSWRMAGMPQRAVQILTDLRRRNRTATFSVRGEALPLFTSDTDALAWLDRNFASPTLTSNQLAEEWRMHRGDPSRTAVVDGSLPLLRPRWRVPVANDPDDEELIRALQAGYREDESPMLPGCSPLAIQGVVLMRTTDNMLAVDLETGKRIWEFPWSEPLAMEGDEVLVPGRNPELRNQQLDERLWHDAIYGQLASDGQSVFLIDQLGYTLRAAYGVRMQIFRGIRVENPDQPKDYNTLVALDIRTQGKYRWRVGGITGEDEPALAGAFFLGAPLVLADDLYVLAEVRGDISLFVLEAETGQLRWSQQLAHVGQINILADALRRLAGASPSYSDGVLVCPTSGGAVVAVDLANRSLLWGFEYPRTLAGPVPGVIAIRNLRSGADTAVDDPWADSTITLADGKAIITPVETNEIFCLDLLSGQLLWREPRPEGALYIAGVHEEKLLIVGDREFRALRLADGQTAWTLPMSSQATPSERPAMPSGRGFLADGHYFLPATTHLLQINLQDGRLVDARSCSEPLGNLVCYEDQVLSLGPRNLTAYYRADRLQEQVQARLKQTPDDPWGLEHQALLWLEAGRRNDALRALRQAVQSYDPNDDRREGARMTLVEALLDALESDFAANGELASEVDALIERPMQREKYLRLMAQGLLRAGRVREAFSAFLALARHQVPLESGMSFESNSLPLLDAGDRVRRVRRDRFVQAGIEQCLEQASSSDRAEMEAQIRQQQQEVLAQKDRRELRGFLQVFGRHELADAVRLELAQYELAEGALLSAELLLTDLLSEETPATAAPAWALMARVMEAAQDPAAAAECFRRLLARWPDQECLDGLTARQLRQQLPPDHPVAEALTNPDAWPYGVVRIKPVSATPNSVPNQFRPYTNFRTIPLLESYGPLPNRLQVAFDSSGSNAIVIQDSLGRERTRVTGARNRTTRFQDDSLTCKAVGHLYLVNLGHGLLAIDAIQPGLSQDKRIRWPNDYGELLSTVANRRDPQIQTRPHTNPWGQQQLRVTGRRIQALGPITAEEVVYLQGNRLFCVDTFSGQTLWIREDLPGVRSIWGDERFVFVAAQGQSKARVFRLVDGEELGNRTVPEEDRHWSTLGRHILTWTEGSRDGQPSWTVRLYDPWSEQDLWQRVYRAESRGYVTPDNELAIVEPDGHFTLLDLRSGEPRIDVHLALGNRPLVSVYLLSSNDQDLLVCGSRPEAERGLTIASFPDAQTAPLIDAAVYAFDRGTGQAQWQVPAVIQGYSLPINQPADVPLLVFLRQVFRAQGARQGRPKLSLLCLDKRDGRLLQEVDDLNYSFGSFLVVGDDRERTVSVRLLNVHNYEFKFTDEPQPPEPPLQTGTASSRRRGAGLSGIVGAVLDAFGKQLQDQGRRGERELLRLIERGGELVPAPQDPAE